MENEMFELIIEKLAGIEELKTEFKDLKNDVTGIKLTLENDVQRNFNLLAEGHMDLTRKLDEVIERQDKDELLTARVSYLEKEVQRLQKKIDAIA